MKAKEIIKYEWNKYGYYDDARHTRNAHNRWIDSSRAVNL